MMKLILLQLLLINFIINVSLSEKIRFDNYQVYSVSIANSEQLKAIQQLSLENIDFNFWTHPKIHGTSDIMIPPHKQSIFLEYIERFNMNYKLKVENVQSLIDNERPAIQPRAFGWTDYHTYDEIYAWCDEQVVNYPNILESFLVGKSHQNRDIRVYRLSHNIAENPAIFIESNIHAREWITSATATWFLNELLTSTNPEIIDLAQTITWYIMPIFNVDGFVYTHQVNRMWRKTRQNHATICFGTDANRNFAFGWMEDAGGSSQDPCSETYAGPSAFSEPETLALATYFSTIAENVKIYISFHSYSHLILLPYGHIEEPSWNHNAMMQMGNRASTAIAQRFGTQYTVGTFHTALYPGGGLSIDYAFEQFQLPAAFLFEFRDNGTYGFILPANQIIPNAEEISDGIIALVDEARVLGIL